MSLRELATHGDLLEASGGDAFIRFDIPQTLEQPGLALGQAIALPRKTHTRRLGLLVMGPPDEAGRLVRALADQERHPAHLAHLAHVTVSRESLATVGSHLPLGHGNDWEWMYAVQAPPRVPGEDRLTPLDESDRTDIGALLADGNPRTDARPFERADQHWVGVRDGRGQLVACGLRERNVAGYPLLTGITVLARERGRGLGLAVTAYLTRQAIGEAGVCTLGMYSDNAVARRVYHGLGYTGDHLWSSRRLATSPVLPTS